MAFSRISARDRRLVYGGEDSDIVKVARRQHAAIAAKDAVEARKKRLYGKKVKDLEGGVGKMFGVY